MTPDSLVQAFAQIVEDVCQNSIRGRVEGAQMTWEEWREVDARFLAMKQMNIRALVMKGEEGQDVGTTGN